MQLLTYLADDSAKGVLIVVEGKKDVEALVSLGVEGPILAAKAGGKAFVQVQREIERTCPREVILLLDFDRRGKEATATFTQNLERAKIKINLTFWKTLSTLVGHEAQCIESLPAYLQTLEQKTR